MCDGIIIPIFAEKSKGISLTFDKKKASYAAGIGR